MPTAMIAEEGGERRSRRSAIAPTPLGFHPWGLGGDELSASGDEQVDPQLVGLVVASLARLGRGAGLDEILKSGAALDPTALDRTAVRHSLSWLERTLLIEEVGQDHWRLATQLAEAFSPRGGARVPPEEDLAEVLAWAEETRGPMGVLKAAASVFEAEEGLPGRVESAAGHLTELQAPKDLRQRYSLDAAFQALEGASPESYAIYRARKLTWDTNPPTLQELADQYGVTRERIRQREAWVEQLIRGQAPGSRDSRIDLIVLAAKRIRAHFGPVARVEEIAAMSALVDPNGHAALEGRRERLALLLRLAGDYQIDGPWLVVPDFCELTDASLAALTADGNIGLDEACRAMGELGVRDPLQVRWVERREGFRVVGDRIVRWGRSLADKAVAMLDVEGEPMTLEDLYERIGEDRNFRGFKGQVQGDARIRRRGLKLYGLDAWGGDEYTTIVDEMTEELDRQGGSMPLDRLARTLAGNFGVSENSVRMYADGPQFDVDTEGCVRRRAGELPIPSSAPPEMTRCCFRLEEGWSYRRLVDHDVLRGSGGGLPTSFAKEIGLRPGDSVGFQSPHGEIRCSWPSHMAHIGSLRLAAEALGASDGDLLFVVNCSPQSFDIRLTTRRSCEEARGFERLALECGRRGSADPERAVAEAIGLDPAVPNLATAVRLRFSDRGERDLASMVPSGAASRDDVLDVLASLGE